MGFNKNGLLKGQYNHYDSYVEGLGKRIIEVINNIPKEERIQLLNQTYDRIELVGDAMQPTQAQIDYCVRNMLYDENVGNQSVNDWYCLLRNTQGNLQVYLNGCKYMYNGNDFLKDNVFCEYAYIINLDTKKLEIRVCWCNKVLEYNLNKLSYKQIRKEVNKL